MISVKDPVSVSQNPTDNSNSAVLQFEPQYEEVIAEPILQTGVPEPDGPGRDLPACGQFSVPSLSGLNL